LRAKRILLAVSIKAGLQKLVWRIVDVLANHAGANLLGLARSQRPLLPCGVIGLLLVGNTLLDGSG
jgi:hypothetical protein